LTGRPTIAINRLRSGTRSGAMSGSFSQSGREWMPGTKKPVGSKYSTPPSPTKVTSRSLVPGPSASKGALSRQRCPVTALVVGMHQERGFRELVRRVGRERATGQRFGRRFDVRIIPTSENLTALCALSAGVFEDWIHTLFREAEALSRPGNLRLYGLLCKVRSTLSGVLTEVLVGGFAHDPRGKDLAEPIPFSGCYFAATGESEDQQAFVRGVFEKLVEEQEDIEWTTVAANDNRLYIFVRLAAVWPHSSAASPRAIPRARARAVPRAPPHRDSPAMTAHRPRRRFPRHPARRRRLRKSPIPFRPQDRRP